MFFRTAHWLSVLSRTTWLYALFIGAVALKAHEPFVGVLLTNVAQVRALSAADAEHSIATKLTARVTYTDPGWALLFVEDATGGIYVMPPADGKHIRQNAVVTVTGVSGAGRLSRIVVATSIEGSDKQFNLQPRATTFNEFFQFRTDSQLVQIEGIVERYHVDESHTYLHLGWEGRRCRVVFPTRFGEPAPNWIDAHVSLKGVAGIDVGANGQIAGPLLYVEKRDDVQIVTPPPAGDPFSNTPRPIASLTAKGSSHRTLVQGAITMRVSDNEIYISDVTGGIRLESDEPIPGSIDDEIRAYGFYSESQSAPYLTETTVKPTGAVRRHAPIVIEAEDALQRRYISERISIHGTLISFRQDTAESVIICDGGEVVFSATIRGTVQPEPSIGTLLQLTGVAERIATGETSADKPRFRLIVATPSDLQIVRRAPYWTKRRTLLALGSAGLVLSLAGIWIVALRYQVRAKTRVIRASLEKEAALEAHFSELVQNANDVIYSHDLDGRLTSMNNAGAQLLRCPEHQLPIGKLILEIFTPTESGSQKANGRQSLAEGKQSYEASVTAADGSRSVVEVSSWLVQKEGRPFAVQGIARDVTARKRAEQLNATLIALGRELSGATTPLAAAQILAAAADKLLGWDSCTLSLRAPGAEAFSPILQQHKVGGVTVDDSARNGAAHDGNLSIEEPQLIRMEGANGDGRALCRLSAPVRQCSRIVGALVIESASPHAYDQNDLGSLQALADFGGAALERISIEEALKANENRFRALTEGSSDAIILGDSNARILYSNKAARAFFGEETLRTALSDGRDRVHPDDLEAVREWWRKMIATPARPWQLEFRALHQDGSWRWIDAHAANLLNDEAARAVVISLRDVSERVEAQTAVRKSEALLRQVLETLPVGVLVVDSKGEVVARNPASLRIWNSFERRPEHGPKSWVRGAADPSAHGEWALSRALQKGELVLNESIEIEAAEGGRKTILNSAAPIRDAQGAVTGAIVVLEDVTQRLKLEQELRQVQKMESVGQLAAGVAHEFNNIMTIVQGYAHLLLDTKGLPPNVIRPLEQIAFGSERAARLTSQLLAFSRKQTVQASAVNLGEIVRNWMNMLRPVLGEDILLQCAVDPGLPSVHADVGMMEQIIMNLAANARDAMPTGGSLSIRVQSVVVNAKAAATNPEARTGPHVCLSVTDTGAGIDRKVLPRIFDPFFTTKDVGKGTGLGLATVYGIVRQHHGWIEVESELGKGSTFKVYLPIHRDDAPRENAESPTLTPATGGSETILVVEDEPSVRTLVEMALKQFGYRVLSAENGRDALRLWDQTDEQIDLLLTDIVMPHGVSGRDLADQLRQRKSDLKVLYTSGYAITGPNRQPLKLDAHARFLAKPYDPTKLAAAVRETLGSNPGKDL